MALPNNASCPSPSVVPDTLLPASCDWCPRMCGANRAAGARGVCGADDTLRIARAALHFWEEPPISGSAGSGAIFFVNCPLRCVYCQNAVIATGADAAGHECGKTVSIDRLAQICLELEQHGARNINMVTPTHYTFPIIEAVARARAAGLRLPIVWNTSGYERVETLRALQGTVDIYLTDYKYASSATAARYSHAADYPEVALAAIEEMVRQTGEACFDEVDGEERMLRGVIVRHLILPGRVEESCAALVRLWQCFGSSVAYSLMNQYTPVLAPDSPAAHAHPELLEHVSNEEYETLLDFADTLGIENYYWQEGPADKESFIPAFDNTGV